MTDDSLWLRRFRPASDTAPRLVCLPHAGGSASYFRPVAAMLSPTVDVLAVQYPGRQDRRGERCVDVLDDLVDQVFDAVRPRADRPLTLFGHSMGATVAFEVARRLEAVGIVPAGLFVSGRRAPHRSRIENVHQRTDDELVSVIAQLAGTDNRLLADEEIRRMLLPALRADYRAIETYTFQPGPGLRCPVVALVGDDDEVATVDEVRAWRDHTTGPFELRVFDGGHFYLNDHAAAVVDELARHLQVEVAGGVS